MNAEAGWYPDGTGNQRYWDGQQWTAHVQPLAPAAPGPGPFGYAATMPGAGGMPGAEAIASPFAADGAPADPTGPRKRRTGLVVGIVGGAVALVAVAAALVLLLPRLGGSSGPEATVEALIAAWEQDDCPAEHALLTDEFRSAGVDAYCDEADYGWAADPTWHAEVVTSFDSEEGVQVLTLETYDDEDGRQVSDVWQYGVVEVDGEWLVDSMDYLRAE